MIFPLNLCNSRFLPSRITCTKSACMFCSCFNFPKNESSAWLLSACTVIVKANDNDKPVLTTVLTTFFKSIYVPNVRKVHLLRLHAHRCVLEQTQHLLPAWNLQFVQLGYNLHVIDVVLTR